MPDEIKGTDAVSASPDADSLFYLLKITERGEIGNRDPDGSVKEFFDIDDIGVIQSTALLQDFNTDEFIEIPGQVNDKWVNGDGSWGGLNGLSLLIPEPALGGGIMMPKLEVTWTAGATDADTELNAALAIKTVYEGLNVESSTFPSVGLVAANLFTYTDGNVTFGLTPDVMWTMYGSQIKNLLKSSIPDLTSATQASDIVTVLDAIIGGKSFTFQPGSNFKFVDTSSSNVIQALNNFYGPNTSIQKDLVNDPTSLKDFSTVKNFVETQIDRTTNFFGNVFNSPTFWNEYKALTNTTNLTTGVAQNFLLIQEITGQLSTGLSFTGLMDTPTGFESGKFLVANETGLEWTGISFTGLPDTPTGYDDGKILQSTADGLEWVDMPAGGGGGSSSTNIIFESDINTMTAGAVGTQLNVPHVPTTDTYSAWDSSNNVWVAPKNMTVLVSCNNKAAENHLNFYGWINHGNSFVAQEGSVKNSIDSTHSALNLSAVIELQAGDNISNSVMVQGAGSSTNLNRQIMTITELSGGTGGGDAGGGSSYEFCKAHIDSNVRLVDSTVQSFVNVNVDPNNLTQGSQDWTHDAGNGIIGLRPPEDGHYNIQGFIQNLGTVALNPSWATVKTKRCFIQKLDISTNTFNPISERTETKDSGNDGILTVEFNEPNIFLTTNDVIFVRTQLNSSTTNAGQFPVSPGAFISLTKAESGGGGGDSGSREFCRAQVSSNSSIGHSTADVDLDISQLATDSKNWTHTDVNRNTVGILVPEDGLYDVSFNIKPLSTNLTWRDNISFLSTALHVIKADGTDVLIQETRNAKQTTNGTLLNNHLYLDNLSLDQGDFLFLRCRVFSSNTSLSWAVDDRFSFLSISKPGGGSSSDGGGGNSNEGAAENNSYLKSFVETFTGKIPDAIIVEDDNPRVYDLRAVITTQSPHIIQYHNGQDHSSAASKTFSFNDDAPGSLNTNLTNTNHTLHPDDNSLQDIIDNGRALYFGGSSSSGGGSSGGNVGNVVSAIIAEDGSLIDSSDNWIQSSTKTANGNYKITFKSGYFTSIPAIVVTPNSSVTPVFKHASAEYFNVTTSECEVFLRAPIDGAGVDASFSIVAHHQDGSGGGGGNSSTGNGGIGSDPGVIAKSNFSELLPDRINVPLTRANGIQERYFTFEGFWEQDINGVLTSVVQYEWNIGGNQRFRINFLNDSNGTFVEYKEQNDTENTDVDFSKIPSAITNQPTLKEFIDANRAIYLGSGGGGSTDGGFIHAVFDGNANIVSKSSEWDTYVNNITFPQGSWNGYAQVNYKNSFTQLPTVLTTAGHVSPNHFFSQVHDQQLTHTAIITSIRGGSAGSSQQAAPFSVTIFSDEIAGGGGSSGGGGGGGGSSTFEDLTDTPNSFIGESGKFVKVNDTEDALEFTTLNVNDALGLQEVDGEDNCSEFHLQSDKTTNSSAFEDSSVNNYSILGSNVIHSTSNPKAGFGSSSIQFNGNGQLLVADGSAFKFFHTKIIKNYTIQLWIFKDALNTREPLLLTAANNNEHGIRLIVDSDNKVKFDVMKGLSNATGLSLASTSTVSAQTWHHIAIVNENNTMSLYLDGNQEQSLAWTSDASTITPNFGLSIGAGPMGAGQAMVFFNGRMQDIRVDKIAFRSDLLPPTSLLNATCDPSAGKSNIDFKMLRDTPVNYSNAGGKYVKVKDGEDGVEFVEISVGSSTTNEFSTAYVTQDQTSDGFITDLEFGNLVVGRTYRISSTICFESNDASALSRADFYNGTQRIVSLYNKGLTSTVSNSMLFVASDSSISVSGNGLTSNNFIHGLPELSFVQLELPPSVVVEIEDIPVAPVAPPGGGIFSVNDVKMHAGIIDYQDSSNTFSDIDSNAFGGNIIDISDIRLISKIDNTGDQKTFEDLDSRLTSIDKLDLADIRVIAQIDHTGHSRTFEDFDSSLTSFGVLSFADMIINTKIYSTGTDSVMTTDPYTSHDHSFSWTGIN